MSQTSDSTPLASPRCVYRAYLWHPDGRWYRLSLASLAFLQFGSVDARIAEFAGARVRIARGVVCAAGADGVRAVRLLRGQILRFDEKGDLIRSDLTRRMRALNSMLDEPSALPCAAGGSVVDARGRFELASLEWTPDTTVTEFLLAALAGTVVLPEYVAFGQIEAITCRTDPPLP